MPKLYYWIHGLIFGILAILAIKSPAVGGEGDTLMHFFWAQHVWTDPAALFNSWAKPFFTLFASPFSYFGFTGIKIFNILCGVLASLFATLYAARKGWQALWLIPILAFLSPAFSSYLNSGLTEPFAALCLLLCLYFLELGKGNQKYLIAAYSLVSFLPFCRGEAQVLIPVFLVYGLLNKQFRYLPLILLGSFMYGFLGSFYHQGDWLWFYQKAYVAGASVYGKGDWSHYFERMGIMMGAFYFLLILAGSIISIYWLFKKKDWWRQDFLLLFGSAWGFFAAHTMVWALGLYASAGLERVLIMVFPLFWLMGLLPFNLFWSKLKAKQGYAILGFIAILGILNMMTDNRAEPYRKTAWDLGPYQTFLRNQVYPFLKERYPDLESRHLVNDLPYLAMLSEHNPLNIKEQSNWQRVQKEIWQQMHRSSLFIWDSHNVPFYTGLNEEKIGEIDWLSKIQSWEMGGRKYILLEANERYPFPDAPKN